MADSEGVTQKGFWSPTPVKPADIDRAFDTVETKIDPGSEMPEAGQTMIRNKVAADIPFGSTLSPLVAYARAPEGAEYEAAGRSYVGGTAGSTAGILPGLALGGLLSAGLGRLSAPALADKLTQTPEGREAFLRIAPRVAGAAGSAAGAFTAKMYGRHRGAEYALQPLYERLQEEGKTAALRDLGLSKLANNPALPSPASIKPPPAFKPTQTFDTRTDKPPGYNLTHGVQTMSNGADVNDSYGAFGRRLQGSPV